MQCLTNIPVVEDQCMWNTTESLSSLTLLLHPSSSRTLLPQEALLDIYENLGLYKWEKCFWKAETILEKVIWEEEWILGSS